MDPQERAALLDRARRTGIPRPELEAAVAILGAGSNRDRVLRRAHAQAWRPGPLSESPSSARS